MRRSPTSHTGTIRPRRTITPSTSGVRCGNRKTRLGGTSSAIWFAASANRRSPSRSKTNDCTSDSAGWLIASVPLLHRLWLPVSLLTATPRPAKPLLPESETLRVPEPARHFDPAPSVHDTTAVLHCKTLSAVLAPAPSWPFSPSHQ